jgi:hypothetical protein
VEQLQRADFRVRLRRAGLTQAEFRTLVQRLCGRELSPTTTSRWVREQRTPPPCAVALLVLIERLTLEERARLL